MIIEGIQPKELHDAILESFSFTWEDGNCFMLFRVSPEKTLSILFEGVTNLIVPRDHPWGDSQCVNEFRYDTNGKVEIEMQSGDMIILQAKSALRVT